MELLMLFESVNNRMKLCHLPFKWLCFIAIEKDGWSAKTFYNGSSLKVFGLFQNTNRSSLSTGDHQLNEDILPEIGLENQK